MGYRLSKKQCEAIEWYRNKNNYIIQISLLPIVIYKNRFTEVLIPIHIDVVEEMYKISQKGDRI